MLSRKPTAGSLEGTALAVIGASKGTNRKPGSKEPGEKSKVWCDYCNKPRHTRETCWKLNGKPNNWKGSHEGRFNKSAHQVQSTTLSPD